MPPSAKTQRKSGPGAPKSKGAVRAKSGCYTCRIRRKKCDEKQNDNGHCETCVRLRLECLGFGSKRPEWLRDNHIVLELREKIKGHLASQGMIKGHSGSGPRSNGPETELLVLRDDYSSSVSPPTTPDSGRGPTLSMDDNRPLAQISSMRDDTYLIPYDTSVSHNSSTSPSMYTGPMLPSYNPPSADLSDDLSDPAWPSNITFSPALRSSFGLLYTAQPEYYEEDPTYSVIPYPQQSQQMPLQMSPYYPEADNTTLVGHYFDNVVDIQYLLADQSVKNLIQNTMRDPMAHGAIRVLSGMHFARVAGRSFHDTDYPAEWRKMEDSLICRQPNLGEADAMAALHLVSVYLFNGGMGHWATFIDLAWRYSTRMLHHNFYPPEVMLKSMTPSNQFIVKATMWFDVLGAASQSSMPLFMEDYRALFKPTGSLINNELPHPPSYMDMLPVMGCENHIVWALAEISALAVWKDEQLRRKCLDYMDLARRGREIEEYLDIPSRSQTDDPLSRNRHLTSEVFRHSARVYLHSVVSGDYPHVSKIAAGVRDTIDVLKTIRGTLPTHRRITARSVVRSVVFSIFICGCLTEDRDTRSYLAGCLDAQKSESVGNCQQVLQLMQKVWDSHRHRRDEPVEWRKTLQNSNVLLV
ncbi:hypothetical protein PLICRDRAFT_45259 [Plicaturopsis crispa FD-325 SS-3]|uniref:Zn(2)-C6 fungal-type domain-containing protein n=1 Tax=Plicaturopsis crispa FD-325 SS-3 TaxID=944288 RepID=A0A0C9TA17_PLICR|nr:hypothetical protein PLICRDRAFT_45259 [Plicaturopsis crispa FD-325 SS-3]